MFFIFNIVAFNNSFLQTAVQDWCISAPNYESNCDDITKWDTSKVTNMSGLFQNQLTCNPNISGITIYYTYL